MKIAAAAVFYLRLANRSPWTPWGIGLTRLDEWLEVTDFNGCLDINFKVLVGAPNSRRKLSFCEKSPVFVATEFFPNAIRFAWKFGLKRHGYMAFSPGGQRFAFSQFSQEIWIKIAWWSRCPNGPPIPWTWTHVSNDPENFFNQRHERIFWLLQNQEPFWRCWVSHLHNLSMWWSYLRVRSWNRKNLVDADEKCIVTQLAVSTTGISGYSIEISSMFNVRR